MGYTNYIHQKRSFTDKEWEQIKQEFEYVKECARIIPIEQNNPNIIAFNGKNGSCETFWLCKNIEDYFNDNHMGDYYKEEFDKKGYHFNFCKTRMFPYDIDVWYLYVVCLNVSKDNIKINRDR
jgi:hypothetical protein|tara:strand:+ start:262 stop:630 length:369 start_codon:yes stop_codon:yes gene_type:complete